MDKRPWTDERAAANGRSVKDNFADWFGYSLARDKQGEPLVLWRGDKNPPDWFARDDRREFGLFFAEELERAERYGQARAYALKVENPLDLRDPHRAWMKDPVAREIIETLYTDNLEGNHGPDGEPYTVGSVIDGLEGGFLWKMDGTGGFTMDAWRQLQLLAEHSGYDSIIVADDGEGVGVGMDWIVFSSNQVKCISEHGGLFLADNESVTDLEAAQRLELASKAAVAAGALHSKTAHAEDPSAMASELNRRLLAAAQRGDVQAFLPLLDLGADIHTKDSRGCSLLQLAAERGERDICISLIHRGLDIHAQSDDGYTALHRAAMNGRTQNCLALLERGACVDAKNKRGHSPLQMAHENVYPETCLALLSFGAQSHRHDDVILRMSPRQAAARGGFSERLIQMLDNETCEREQDEPQALRQLALQSGQDAVVALLDARQASLSIQKIRQICSSVTPF